MNFFKKLAAVTAIASASFGGGVMTLSNSVLKIDPPRVLINSAGHKTYISEAVVWGSWDKIDPDTLITIWRLKKRECAVEIAKVRFSETQLKEGRSAAWADSLGDIESEALMLTKAYRESGFSPYIMRFERGRYEGDWKRADGSYIFTEYQATSGGLFQIMGFNYDKLPCAEMNGLADSLKWGYLCANLTVQIDLFDKFMSARIREAARARNGKDLIYKAIAAYGGNASRIESLSDMNYQSYLNYMQTGAFTFPNKPRKHISNEPIHYN
jgi:hypothetical protein